MLLGVKGEKVCLQVIDGVNMSKKVHFGGNVKFATVSRETDPWHVALAEKTTDCLLNRNCKGAVGVGLCVKTPVTLLIDEVEQEPKAHKWLSSCTKSLRRKKKASMSRLKANTKLARVYLQISNIRQHRLCNLTNKLFTEFEVITVENLNVRDIVKNHCLARPVCGNVFFEFRKQLEYKSAMTGSKVAIAYPWFPSDITCSPCGTIHDMPRSKRTLSWGLWKHDKQGLERWHQFKELSGELRRVSPYRGRL